MQVKIRKATSEKDVLVIELRFKKEELKGNLTKEVLKNLVK
jgi:hypothetical protein